MVAMLDGHKVVEQARILVCNGSHYRQMQKGVRKKNYNVVIKVRSPSCWAKNLAMKGSLSERITLRQTCPILIISGGIIAAAKQHRNGYISCVSLRFAFRT
ncbi:hypothetical protein GDO78_004190 [Eleutherodactylus coqui]|uniref:Uncharacterized protein n=1 Tax=Eleutherodactylus coqui TaxID=57060 RepID=A0A8J6EQK8_ELECQ|nr:hypothetical protein GDO78_004190 [Eleutherodactylus coqui]